MEVNFTGTEPTYARPGDAGADLRLSDDVAIPALGRALAGTGTSVAIPDGYVGLVLARSGTATRRGVTLSNCVGVIDSGYRGEVKLPLLNGLDVPVSLRRGERVAQLVVVPAPAVSFARVEALDETERGCRGFGSSGAR